MRKKYQSLLLIFISLGCLLGLAERVHSDTAKKNEPSFVEAESITLSRNVLSSRITISNTSHNNDVVILRKGITSSKIGDYRNASEVQNIAVMYKGFQRLASGIGLIYNQPDRKGNASRYLSFNGEKETIQISYDYVGMYETGGSGTPKFKKAGVCVTLSNIIVGNSPQWTKDQIKCPWIESSNSFSDGLVYGNIKKMNAEFVFFDSDSGKKLDFSSSENAYLSFSSLNAYPNASLVDEREKKDRHEFVGSENLALVKHAKIASDSLLSYHSQPSSVEERYDQHTFYASKAIEGTDFTDYLNGQTFNRAAVQFPLCDIKNSFKFGSTYGRGWLSFESGI